VCAASSAKTLGRCTGAASGVRGPPGSPLASRIRPVTVTTAAERLRAVRRSGARLVRRAAPRAVQAQTGAAAPAQDEGDQQPGDHHRPAAEQQRRHSAGLVGRRTTAGFARFAAGAARADAQAGGQPASRSCALRDR
jgi:hypothetical protein